MEELVVNVELKYNYGELKAGYSYSVEELLDEITRLENEVIELKEEIERITNNEYDADVVFEERRLEELEREGK